MDKTPEIIKETRMLVDIKECPYLRWNTARGKRLKALLDKVSNNEVSDKLSREGYECSRQLVDKITNGVSKSINSDLLIAICNTFNISLSEIIPIRVENESKEIADSP